MSLLVDFKAQMNADLENVFLKHDFSVTALYETTDISKEINIQFFTESLDRIDTLYHHAYARYDDIPDVTKNDFLTIGNVKYGIIDVSVDEFKSGVNLFLQKA